MIPNLHTKDVLSSSTSSKSNQIKSQMEFTSRRLLPRALTYSYYSSYSSSPSPSPSHANPCLFPCYPYCPSDSNCPWTYSSPPLPPPPPSFLSAPYNPSPSRSRRLSTPGIITVSVISSLFLLTVYLILLTRSRRNRPNNRSPHQGPTPPPGGGGQWGEEEELNQNQAMVHPIWLINTVGLQPAVIGSIAVCEYKKGEGLIEGDYCSICLSEFEEGENLRLLPKCNHAFHIPCIDTWLRSHTNCPLCRAPILSPVSASSSIAVLERASSGSGGGVDVGENTEGGDTAVDDTGDSSGVAEGGNGHEGLNDKSGAEEVEVGASVGRRSVSMDGNVTILVNMDEEGYRRGRVGGVRSLPGSGRFCRLGRDS